MKKICKQNSCTSFRLAARSALLKVGAVPIVTLDLAVRTDAAVLDTAKENSTKTIKANYTTKNPSPKNVNK